MDGYNYVKYMSNIISSVLCTISRISANISHHRLTSIQYNHVSAVFQCLYCYIEQHLLRVLNLNI